ncbi:uncharacterized protein H6S33_010797 [Morchella sextelata]|uniref:uncharacterized protein n=1 Tax=Morchella sextelata TaxID=1174677 RepID=UPI001D0465E2|nr:uncharacterized protein H6S33_010797 [Morchella sextelata]KAH0611532.1 hypothetical protein H6S33_010797 [Morchella sextelata]
MPRKRPPPIQVPPNHFRARSSSTGTVLHLAQHSPTPTSPSSPHTKPPTAPRSPLARQNSNAPSISTPLSINLSLTPPSVVEMWILCRQTGHFYTHFIDTVTATSLDSRRAKITQKNNMYAMSERALTVAREFAMLTHYNVSVYDLGQRKLAKDWAICDTPSYDKLFTICGERSAEIFGERLGNRIDHRVVYEPPYVAASRSMSRLEEAGLPQEFHNVLLQSIQHHMDDWGRKVGRYIMCFDPFRPLDAVRLMMETAKELSVAARAVVRLVEHHYRLCLGLVPVEGVTDAKKAYDMLVLERGEDVGEELVREMQRIAGEVETRLWVLRGERREARAGLPAVMEGSCGE